MIGKEMEILGGPLGSDLFPFIDRVAREKGGRPLLIFADVQPDENIILNITAQIDWFLRNRTLLRQLYPKLRVDDTVSPRAALIYPEFPLLTKRFVRAAPPHSLLLYEYRCFQVLKQRFLYLERFLGEPVPPVKAESLTENLPPFRSGMTGEDSGITSEEREAFLS